MMRIANLIYFNTSLKTWWTLPAWLRGWVLRKMGSI